MKKLISLLLILIVLIISNCSSETYLIKSHDQYYLDQAKPELGKFKYIKRNIEGKAVLDKKNYNEEIGTEEFVHEITSLSKQAFKDLKKKAQLKDNQALYNVRISNSAVSDISPSSENIVLGSCLLPGLGISSLLFDPLMVSEKERDVHYNIQVIISADVIEFIE